MVQWPPEALRYHVPCPLSRRQTSQPCYPVLLCRILTGAVRMVQCIVTISCMKCTKMPVLRGLHVDQAEILCAGRRCPACQRRALHSWGLHQQVAPLLRLRHCPAP